MTAKNKHFSIFTLIIGMMLVFSLTNCGGGSGYTSIDAVTKYLLSVKGGTNVDDPVPLKVNLDLQVMTEQVSGWQRLLGAIETAGKYVALDLSDCKMSGGPEFLPARNVRTGKSFIVLIILPKVAESTGGAGDVPNPAFRHFSNLKTVSAEKLTSIGVNSFSTCKSLISVDFPAAIKIDGNAFRNCTSLTSVSFPVAESTGWAAFSGCTSLTSMSFPVATTIATQSFDDCNSLTEIPITFFPAVTTINFSAFSGCTSLTSVSLSEVEFVGNGVFQSCTSLTSVDFPAAIRIDYACFLDCTSLISVSFPNLTSLSDNIFTRCTSLSNVSFPKVTSIGLGSFSGCTSLSNADFPAAASIDVNAFDLCNSLVSITLGTIMRDDFNGNASSSGGSNTTPGNLRAVYFGTGGGAGTYVTNNPGLNARWRKQ